MSATLVSANFRMDRAIEILSKTRDGEDLSPGHLSLVQCICNGNVRPDRLTAFDAMYEKVRAGTYEKPWFHGFQNLTQDHEGYVYWRDKQVEHYSFRDLEQVCRASPD